jgi:nucleoside-diphosphate-sugar epimerase
VYGPLGTFDGGREKAPAALCRKIIYSKLNKTREIDVWGDGEQTRSFLFIDDCINGTMKVFNSNSTEVYNVGSDEQVSINQMIDIIQDIAQYKVKKNYQLDKPKGVRGRTSDNSKIIKNLSWSPSIRLYDGLKKTYAWIEEEINSGNNIKKFSRF